MGSGAEWQKAHLTGRTTALVLSVETPGRVLHMQKIPLLIATGHAVDENHAGIVPVAACTISRADNSWKHPENTGSTKTIIATSCDCFQHHTYSRTCRCAHTPFGIRLVTTHSARTGIGPYPTPDFAMNCKAPDTTWPDLTQTLNSSPLTCTRRKLPRVGNRKR